MSAPLANATSCKYEGDHLLIVEGKDDCNSVWRIASQHAIEETFGIWEGGSDQGALSRFGGILIAAANRPVALGLVLDCDSSDGPTVDALSRRWAEIRHRLVNPGYAVPQEPDPAGTVLDATDGLPRVGVWIMPNNADAGMLEDFLMSSVSSEKADYVREIVRKATQDGATAFKPVHEAKAIAHTYLAWQDEPGYPLGLGIKAKHFDSQGDQVLAFVAWLKRLFGPEHPVAAAEG